MAGILNVVVSDFVPVMLYVKPFFNFAIYPIPCSKILFFLGNQSEPEYKTRFKNPLDASSVIIVNISPCTKLIFKSFRSIVVFKGIAKVTGVFAGIVSSSVKISGPMGGCDGVGGLNGGGLIGGNGGGGVCGGIFGGGNVGGGKLGGSDGGNGGREGGGKEGGG